jgi:hypothetical protein
LLLELGTGIPPIGRKVGRIEIFLFKIWTKLGRNLFPIGFYELFKLLIVFISKSGT